MIELGVIDLDTALHENYQYPDIQDLHATNPEAIEACLVEGEC
jgi:hypothetical protein